MSNKEETMAAEVKTFDFELPTRIRFGAGVVKSVGEEARSLGAEHILIITDSGIMLSLLHI